MRSSFRSTRLAGWRSPAAVAIGLICLAISPARAGQISVAPTTLAVTPRSPTRLFSIANQSDVPIRFQLGVFAWTQSPDGAMALAPTEDVVVFPTLLTIPAGQTAKVRVGAATSFAGDEKSYRVIVQQLPDSVGADSAAQVQIVTKFSLPLFMQQPRQHASALIASPAVQAGLLTFAVSNTGSEHLMLRHVHAVGADAAGQKTFEADREGWYVLAHGQRDYRLSIDDADCRRTSRVHVEAVTDDAPVQFDLPMSPGDCGGHGGGTAFIAATAEH